MVHKPLSSDGVHPQISLFLREIVSPLPLLSGLVCHILPFVYFFKEYILSFVTLTNATPALSML